MFWGLLVRLVTGASWTSVEAVLEWRVSDTTRRSRRDEWIEAGVFDRLRSEALAAFDRVIGLDVSEFHQRVAHEQTAQRRICAGDTFGEHDHVGHDTKTLTAEPMAETPEGRFGTQVRRETPSRAVTASIHA